MQLDARSAVSSWSLSGWLASTTLATLAFWSMFGACVDASDASAPDATVPASAAVRAVVGWDPRACGAPHRVIVELEDPGGGQPRAASVPCTIGEVTLEAPRAGVYTGRAYAWSSDAWGTDAGSATPSATRTVPLVLVLDAPVTRREVPTPR